MATTITYEDLKKKTVAEQGFDKSQIKVRMKTLRAEREKALAAHDSAKLKVLRTERHSLNHRIRVHMV